MAPSPEGWFWRSVRRGTTALFGNDSGVIAETNRVMMQESIEGAIEQIPPTFIRESHGCLALFFSALLIAPHAIFNWLITFFSEFIDAVTERGGWWKPAGDVASVLLLGTFRGLSNLVSRATLTREERWQLLHRGWDGLRPTEGRPASNIITISTSSHRSPSWHTVHVVTAVPRPSPPRRPEERLQAPRPRPRPSPPRRRRPLPPPG